MTTTEKDAVVDLNDIKEEMESIRREALSHGFALDADSPIGELRKSIAKIRKERAGKPPCYRRAYLTTAPQCRVCDLRHECAKPDDVPEYLPPEDLVTVQCDRCKQGTLSIELTDQASGTVKNYGCSTTGCANTLLDQGRHVEENPEYHDKTDKTGVVTTRRAVKMTVEELDNEIVNVVRDGQLVVSKRAISAKIPASYPRVLKRIDAMVKQKRIKFRKNKGYWIPE